MAPIAVEKAVVLMNCQTVSMVAVAVSSLDGGESYAAAQVATATVSLPLLASDPYYVCFNGQHNLVGVMGIVCIIFYVMGLPLLTFIWLRREPWLHLEIQHVNSEVARQSAAIVPLSPSFWPIKSSRSIKAVSWRIEASAQPRRRRASWDDDVGAVPHDPMLTPFLADSGYGPRAWYFRHLDFCAMVSLAVLQVRCVQRALLGAQSHAAFTFASCRR